jgi:hypothetical protein
MLQLAAGPCPCLYVLKQPFSKLQLLSPPGWPTPISVPGRAIFTARASMWPYLGQASQVVAIFTARASIWPHLGQASQVVVKEAEFWFAQADLVVRTAKITGSLMKFDHCLLPSLLPRPLPPPANLRAASAPELLRLSALVGGSYRDYRNCFRLSDYRYFAICAKYFVKAIIAFI